ncbi:MAG TPA: hypothetical protein VJT16_08225 [Streptosporangiaceae bacterium]|nr:hypothetical protein [Streptosporangiaceae bacterium]
MDPTGNQPDDVTQAALETVSEAVELAEQEDRRRRHRGIRARISRRIERRAAATKRVRRLSTALSGPARRGASITGRGVSAGSRWLSAHVLSIAPRLPVRDQATLRRQFPGQSPDQLAESVIEGASKASAAVGIAVGTWAVLPFVPAAGVEITTETLSVVGIEIKLVAELHEIYGQAVPGNRVDRMTAYVGAWAQRRGVALAPGGLVLAAGSPVARQLQRRLAAKASRSVLSLGPLLTGAAAGGLINRRETRKLGRVVSDDLRKRSPYGGADWPTADAETGWRR